ncbi:hypothetical protein [Aureimonas sp. AU4]|uniref:hypothetical protein n=1 Tax=Aureimonas sp. AU4 TaxID=1638163 RepID=UPI000784F92C|nr:hypothetical protein [Aureimonas sp. AU4]
MVDADAGEDVTGAEVWEDTVSDDAGAEGTVALGLVGVEAEAVGLVVEEGAEVAVSAAAVLDEGVEDNAVGFWVDVAVGEDDEGAEKLDVEVGAEGAFVDEGALVSVMLDGEGEAVGAWVGAVAVELVGDVVAEGEEAFVGAAEVVEVGDVDVAGAAVEVVGDVEGAVPVDDVGVELVGDVVLDVGVDDWLACTP